MTKRVRPPDTDQFVPDAAFLARAARATEGIPVRFALADRSIPDPGLGPVIAGWWCHPEARSSSLVVLPNPWQHHDAVAEAELLVWNVVAATSERLASVLSPPRPATEWHLILAPLLVHLTSALLDRALFVGTVRTLFPDVVLLGGPLPVPPATMAHGVDLTFTDVGSRGLTALAAVAAGMSVEPVRGNGAGLSVGGTSPRPRSLSEILLEDVVSTTRAVVSRADAAAAGLRGRRRVVFVGQDPLGPGDALRLARAVPGLRFPDRRLRRPALSPPPARATERARLHVSALDNTSLESLVWGSLSRLLPRTVVEGHGEVIAQSERWYGEPAHVIIGNYAADEAQNEFIARSHTAGRSLTFAQHGGFYLQSSVGAQERLERRPGSTFLSWGGTGQGVVVAPAPRLARLKDAYRGGSGRIVIIEPVHPPMTYVIRFSGMPMANEVFRVEEHVVRFVQALQSSERARLTLKRFPAFSSEEHRHATLAALPYDGPVRSSRATDWMRRAALTVVTYPDTPFIEAMLIGGPTIGLWDPDLWPLREDARSAMDALVRGRVVFGDPAEAAAHTGEVAADPARWWHSEPVQAARQTFLNRFAKLSDDPLRLWARHLASLPS